MMKRWIAGAVLSLGIYGGAGQTAMADNWGCTVVLCMSNPGGPTQYKECVPPINKLRAHLAKGLSFPKCDSIGVKVSKPSHEPFGCKNKGKLVKDKVPVKGRPGVHCETTKLVEQPLSECEGLKDGGKNKEGIREVKGAQKCFRYEQNDPIVHERPNMITVHIAGQSPKVFRY